MIQGPPLLPLPPLPANSVRTFSRPVCARIRRSTDRQASVPELHMRTCEKIKKKLVSALKPVVGKTGAPTGRAPFQSCHADLQNRQANSGSNVGDAGKRKSGAPGNRQRQRSNWLG